MKTVFMLFTISFKKIHYFQYLLLKLHAIYYKSLSNFIEMLKPFKQMEICEYLVEFTDDTPKLRCPSTTVGLIL